LCAIGSAVCGNPELPAFVGILDWLRGHVEEFELDSLQLEPIFTEVIESRRELVDGLVGRLMDVVQSMPCAQEHLDAVRLALYEALANAIIHGNREHPEKKVKVSVACADQENLLIAVTDEGEGFDPATIPDPTLAENIYSSGGRGLFLMNCLMDQAEFRMGGRQVVLRKRVRPPAPEAPNSG